MITTFAGLRPVLRDEDFYIDFSGSVPQFIQVAGIQSPGLTASPAVGEYVIPSLLGRSDQLMIGRVLSDEFFANRDWPVASAVAIAMLVLLVVPIMLFQRYQNRELRGHA